MTSFQHLISRACNCDLHAAAEIVRRYEPELRRVIRYELRNPQVRRVFDSLDVFQSVMAGFFARLYAGEVQATDPGQLLGLLRVMARHKVADKARYVQSVKRGGAVRRAGMGSGLPVPDTENSPDEVIATHDLVSVVRDRLGQRSGYACRPNWQSRSGSPRKRSPHDRRVFYPHW